MNHATPSIHDADDVPTGVRSLLEHVPAASRDIATLLYLEHRMAVRGWQQVVMLLRAIVLLLSAGSLFEIAKLLGVLR